jgi:protein TonB
VPAPEDPSQREMYPERRLLPSRPAVPDPEVQRKRMLIALGVLLVALVAVVLKDWDFWFPASEEAQSITAPRQKPSTTPASSPAVSAAPTRAERQAAKVVEPSPAGAPFAATAERAALPPLQVEVVAGNRHTRLPGRSNAIRLDMDSGAASPAAQAPPAGQEPVIPASDRVQMSPQTQQSVSVSVPPDYPLLARQMKVQGAVILQALISREGSIQELQILSGPTILAAAAREAVKQWRFKPYYQDGQPVETQARITVNFTISTN